MQSGWNGMDKAASCEVQNENGNGTTALTSNNNKPNLQGNGKVLLWELNYNNVLLYQIYVYAFSSMKMSFMRGLKMNI